MKKRFLAMFLALAMCLALLPAAALAADSAFTLENGALKEYNGPGGDVVIPDGVTGIMNGAFATSKGVITSVTIPDSVTELSWGAFLYVPQLTNIHVSANNPKFASIDGALFDKAMTKLIQYPFGRQGAYTIPDGVTCIGNFAFDGCTGLTGVAIPDSVTSIESGAFSGCTGLTSVALPERVTSIGSNAFAGCRNLKSVHIPNGVTSIGEGAFYQCFALESVTLPSGLRDVGLRVFAGCTALSEVVLPDGLTTIGGAMFDTCEKLTSLVIPDSVTTIGNGAFRGCTGLTSMAIPDGVTAIGEWAFQNCIGLEEISIPQSVTQIGVGAFAETPWQNKQGEFVVANGILVQYQGKGGAVTIPEGVTGIVAGAFDGCDGVTEVIIPEGVTSIGDAAFRGCTGLTNVTAPSTIRYVGMEAFAETPWQEAQNGLVVMGNVLVYAKGQERELTVPNGVTTIGPDAFKGCPELVRVTIPAGVTSIDEVSVLGIGVVTGLQGSTACLRGAFGCCDKLTDVFLENGDAQIGEYAFSWLEPGFMMGMGGTIKSLDVTVHAPSGGKVEAYCKEHQIRFAGTGGESASRPTVESIPSTGTAYARTQTVKLDGKDVEFQCYAVKDANGNETNYVKLRDLAQALDGTKAQFNVGWDQASNKISIIPSTPYQALGGEGSTPYSGDQPYTSVSDDPVRFDGTSVNLTSFQLKDSGGNGYTYYKLRDLGQLLNFNVTWNGKVVVESDKPYTG